MEKQSILNGSYSINENGQVFNTIGKEIKAVAGKVRLTINGQRSYYFISQLLESVTFTKKEEKKETTTKKIEKKIKKENKGKKIGIIQSIFNLIVETKKGISINDIVSELEKKFPEKESKSMCNTVRVQIGSKKPPSRMERERKITFIVTGEKDERIFKIK